MSNAPALSIDKTKIARACDLPAGSRCIIDWRGNQILAIVVDWAAQAAAGAPTRGLLTLATVETAEPVFPSCDFNAYDVKEHALDITEVTRFGSMFGRFIKSPYEKAAQFGALIRTSHGMLLRGIEYGASRPVYVDVATGKVEERVDIEPCWVSPNWAVALQDATGQWSYWVKVTKDKLDALRP